MTPTPPPHTPPALLRILVFGARDWTDHTAITHALADARPAHLTPEEVLVIHGGCRGADRLAHHAAITLGYAAGVPVTIIGHQRSRTPQRSPQRREHPQRGGRQP